MIVVNYSRQGTPMPDHMIEALVLQTITKQEQYPEEKLEIKVSTEMAVLGFRVAIVENRLAAEDIQFQHEGEPLMHNITGRILSKSEGFCQTYDNLLDRFLKI